MVTSGGEGIRKLAEDIFVVVMNLACLAVEKLRSADDFATERSADGLMAKANTQDGKFSSETLDQFHGNARFLRSARAGRDHNPIGLTTHDFFDGDFIVAVDFDLATQLAEVLREVVGKGIVVVEKQDHE